MYNSVKPSIVASLYWCSKSLDLIRYFAKKDSANAIITNIDGKDISGMNVSDVASLVRGPENSIVELTIIRDGKKLIKKSQLLYCTNK